MGSRLLWCGGLICVLALLVSGCAHDEAYIAEPREEAVSMSAGGQLTLLEKLKGLNDALESAEISRSLLMKQLEEEHTAHEKAASDLRKAQRELEQLRKQQAELDSLRPQLDGLQKRLLAAEDEKRALREQLLRAKLTQVRTEQALVAIKIELAKERRSALRKAEARRAARAGTNGTALPREREAAPAANGPGKQAGTTHSPGA